MNAGIELLEEGGTADISLRAIARRAGVSHGAPRRWFPTHRVLLASIAEVGLRDLTDVLDIEDADPTPLNTAARAYVAFAADRPAMFDRLVAHVVRTIDAPDPELVAATVWVGIHGIATLAATGSLQLLTADTDIGSLIARVVTGAISAQN